MITGLVIVALVSWGQAAVVGTVVAHGDVTTMAEFRLLYADITTFVFVARLQILNEAALLWFIVTTGKRKMKNIDLRAFIV